MDCDHYRHYADSLQCKSLPKLTIIMFLDTTVSQLNCIIKWTANFQIDGPQIGLDSRYALYYKNAVGLLQGSRILKLR